MTTYVIREKIYDESGEWIDSKETWRGNERPNWKLTKNEAVFTVHKSGIYDPRLAYPAAYGLTEREGV